MRKSRARAKQEKENEAAYGPPQFEGKIDYLYYVGAEDCVKMENRWKEGFQMVKPTPVLKPKKSRMKSVHRIKKFGKHFYSARNSQTY